MSEMVSGISGKQYTLHTHIGSGGEGKVYETNEPNIITKLYDLNNVDAVSQHVRRRYYKFHRQRHGTEDYLHREVLDGKS